MSRAKETSSFDLNLDQIAWLKDMAQQYGLNDDGKALRVVLDYAMKDADPGTVFEKIRCNHCGG